MCYSGNYKEKQMCEQEQTYKSYLWFGSFSETWKREGGIASNRISERYGEEVV